MCQLIQSGSNLNSESVEKSGETNLSTIDYPGYVPNDDVSRAAYDLANSSLPKAILNHSVRVYLYAKALSEIHIANRNEELSMVLLFAACILHDIGCAEEFDGPQRFEVEGADAAKGLLEQHGISSSDSHQVWIAIACHTSPGIAERITPLARLIRLGVLIDLHKHDDFEEVTRLRPEIEKTFPRFSIEKVLGDSVVDQALRQRQKAPAVSWPGHLLKAKLEDPHWDGVNKAF